MVDTLNHDVIRKLSIRRKPHVSRVDTWIIQFNNFVEYMATFRYEELKNLSTYFLDKVINIFIKLIVISMLILILIIGKNKSIVFI